MKGFNETREEVVNNLNYYRAYENELLHRYGVEWRRDMSIEEETELEARKNKVNWKVLGIAK